MAGVDWAWFVVDGETGVPYHPGRPTKAGAVADMVTRYADLPCVDSLLTKKRGRSVPNSENLHRLNGPMVDRLRECAADTSSNWDGRITIYPPEARQLVFLIDEGREIADLAQAVPVEVRPVFVQAVKSARTVADGEIRQLHSKLDGLRAELASAVTLIRELADPDPCSFDHHGGCQAHGYLSLEPGEKCPQAAAKELLFKQLTVTRPSLSEGGDAR